MYTYPACVGLAAEQNELVFEVDDGVVFHCEVVGLVVAVTLVRQVTGTHSPVKLWSLELGSWQTDSVCAHRRCYGLTL